jgi:hypothetical protein
MKTLQMDQMDQTDRMDRMEAQKQVLSRLKRVIKIDTVDCNDPYSFYDNKLIEQLYGLKLSFVEKFVALTPKFKNTEWMMLIDDEMALVLIDLLEDNTGLSFCLAFEMLNPAKITISSEFSLSKLRTQFFTFIATHQETIEDEEVNDVWRYLNEELQENKEELKRLADLSCKLCTLTLPMGKRSYVFWCTQLFLSSQPDVHVGLFLCLGHESERFGNIFWKMFKPSQQLLASLPTITINSPLSEFIWRLRGGHDPFDPVFLLKAEKEPDKKYIDVLWFFMWINCTNTTHIDKICDLKVPTGVPLWPPKGIFIPNPLLEYLSLKSFPIFQMYQHTVHQMVTELE